MNPFQLMQMMKTAQNPMSIIQQMAGNNPQMQQMLNNLQGKTPQEMEQYARNLFQSRGVNISQFLSQYGITVK